MLHASLRRLSITTARCSNVKHIAARSKNLLYNDLLYLSARIRRFSTCKTRFGVFLDLTLRFSNQNVIQPMSLSTLTLQNLVLRTAAYKQTYPMVWTIHTLQAFSQWLRLVLGCEYIEKIKTSPSLTTLDVYPPSATETHYLYYI